MPFREYKAHVALPNSLWDERFALEAQIGLFCPGMAVQFEQDSQLKLIGVEAPDRASAATILPFLEKLIADQSQKDSNGH